MTPSPFPRLKTATLVVAAGSVDGVCTAAAVLRIAACGRPTVTFTQAFQVDRLAPATWAPRSRVVLVDLAVNNRDPAMTAGFLRAIVAAGHEVLAVIDEHDAHAWASCFEAAGFDPAGLAIAPVTGKGSSVNSSGALLLFALGDEPGIEVIRELCLAADAGDRMDFVSNPIARDVNAAMKSAIADDTRRVRMAGLLAAGTYLQSDPAVAGWIDEYSAIQRANAQIVANAESLGDGLVRCDGTGQSHDATSVMLAAYQTGAKVVILRGTAFNRATKVMEPSVSLGVAPGVKLDLLAVLRGGGIASAGGMPAKVTISPADERESIVLARTALTSASQA